MKKRFFLIISLFLTGILFPSSVNAVVCDATVENQCGVPAGCSDGQKCTRITVDTFSCYTSTSCPVTGAIPTISPTPPIEPVPTTDDVCPANGTLYPPNSACHPLVETFEVQHVTLSGSQFFTYPLTCIEAPTVNYSEVFTSVSPPPSIKFVNVTTDISDAQLGFLGPSSDVLATVNPDTIAQRYLFNALFDKPGSNPNASRESFRTFWRMLDSLSQAQIKAFYIDTVKDFTYYYVGEGGKQKKVKIDELRGKLPFCLKNYGLDANILACWKDSKYVEDYLDLSNTVREEYDALLPFDFDNMRSYIVDDLTISKENIPYLKAILSGLKGQNTLLSSVPGLFDFYTPDWAIQGLSKHLSAPVILEPLQYPSLILRASLSSCTVPPKSSSLVSPKTYPDVTSMNQIVTVPVSAQLISSTPDQCICKGVSRRYSQTTCLLNRCTFIKGQSTYQQTGSATGHHLSVFNNPYVDSLTDLVVGGQEPVGTNSTNPIVSGVANLLNGVVGIFSKSQPSFYKMLLPSFAPDPEKVLVNAPFVKNTTDNPYATVQGSSVIYRENNLAQDAMALLQNCWLVPNDSQKNPICGTVKSIATASAAICPTDCEKNIPSAATAMALKPTLEYFHTLWLGVGHPALDKYETVVNAAIGAGINPIFAITIWYNESNSSNYDGVCIKLGNSVMTSGFCTRLLDFGINLDSIASNYATKTYHFDEQLQNFLLLPNYYKTACKAEMEKYQCPMRIFAAMFRDGTCEPSAGSDGYLSAITKVFNNLAPNEKFPCYPSAYP